MYDIIVVGGGHAGIEAALASARLNKKTALISLSIEEIGKMPCNPSIGGPAKGIVVREIDALGGQMGITADKTALQVKMLNMSKGPGVQSLRVQSDKLCYQKMMQEELLNQENLDVIEGMAIAIETENQVIKGIKLSDGQVLSSKIVILTTGTYMKSLTMISDQVTSEGPDHEPTTSLLSDSLEQCGIELFRLKTGTPPRVKTSSIDFTKTSLERGSEDFYAFSDSTTKIRPFEKQLPCYLTYTNEKTHQIIHQNLHRSSMYSGVVKGVGPRYCPSIEDKLVRFSDKPRHQLFLEPESEYLDTTYIQGFSSSMPKEVQEEMVHSLAGLENAIIDKYAYAIEYDAINPLQLKPNLENKKVENLFCAGQINGTSGYEEAAGQGLMAAINACLKLDGKDPLILRKDESYIGVMIDDLCTKGTLEPYRLLTSRAEFRLLLRHDNATIRLIEYGYQVGLVSEQRYQKHVDQQKRVKAYQVQLEETRFTPKSEINKYLNECGYESLKDGVSATTLIARPHLTLSGMVAYLPFEIEEDCYKQIEIEAKYAGYIEKAKKEANRMAQMDFVKLPEKINYQKIQHLSLEARQKLELYRPMTIGHASRISGINPSDIQVLAIYLKTKKESKK
ncbi:MAG: tRNA uridine-5-carboxymethylaminomethyl(34) synthesis enzyme MnmG [Erysipelotrichaceae bacterium]